MAPEDESIRLSDTARAWDGASVSGQHREPRFRTIAKSRAVTLPSLLRSIRFFLKSLPILRVFFAMATAACLFFFDAIVYFYILRRAYSQ